jgi:serine phosphatase RsbU (regulator of sigma subunit)/PAS domain-containing protein
MGSVERHPRSEDAAGALSADERLAWEVAVDAAGVGAFDWDLETGRLRWDDRLLALFGLERSAFGGTIDAFEEHVHPEDLPRVTAALQRAIDSCGEYAAEYRAVRPDHTERWVSARGRAVAGPTGRATRVLGAAYDTTAARDADVRVARVLEAMPTAFFHLDRDWRFTYVNAEAEALLAAPRAQLVGGVIWDLFPAALDSEFEDNYRRAMSSGEPVTFDAHYPPPLDAWYEVRGWPTPDGLSVYFNDVTVRRTAQEMLTKAARRASVVARVSDELAKTLDAEEAVAGLATVLVPELADWCIVTLVDDVSPTGWRRQLKDVGWWHADQDRRALVDRYTRVRIPALLDDSFVHRALDGSEAVVVASEATDAITAVLEPGEARDLARQLAPYAAAVLPLRGRGRTVGLLSVFRDEATGPFTDDDLTMLRDVSARAGLALDNARLFKQQRDLAEGLQRSLLTAPPEPDHLHIVVRYSPAAQAAQVGGDWYDAFLQRDEATVLVIGDVVGHDAAAAAAMGQVRGVLRGIAAHSSESPAEVLRGVDQLIETLRLDTTATAVVARLEQTPEELEAGVTRLRWSTAGHPPPIVLRPDGTVHYLVGSLGPSDPVDATRPLDLGSTDLLLGLDPQTERREHVVTLPRESVVLLYTDGLIERRGEGLDAGFDRLDAVLSELAAEDLAVDDLCDRLLERMVPEAPEDDVALVAVKLHRQDVPRPTEAVAGDRNVALHLPG